MNDIILNVHVDFILNREQYSCKWQLDPLSLTLSAVMLQRISATASSSMDTDQSSTEVASFLSKLRSPAPSDLSRKRKLSSNPPKGMKKEKGSASSEPSNVSISDRVREFPGEHLCRNLGKLFCNACREPISVKKSVISQHIKSAKHERGKAR